MVRNLDYVNTMSSEGAGIMRAIAINLMITGSTKLEERGLKRGSKIKKEKQIPAAVRMAQSEVGKGR